MSGMRCWVRVLNCLFGGPFIKKMDDERVAAEKLLREKQKAEERQLYEKLKKKFESH